MKLSEIKGERVFDVIADVIEPVAVIAESPAAKELFTRKSVPEGMNAKDFVVSRLRSGIPAIMKENKEELVAIFAAINGETVAEYKEHLDLLTLIKDATELLTDDAFKSLFISAQTGRSSGSARENTEAH